LITQSTQSSVHITLDVKNIRNSSFNISNSIRDLKNDNTQEEKERKLDEQVNQEQKNNPVFDDMFFAEKQLEDTRVSSRYSKATGRSGQCNSTEFRQKMREKELEERRKVWTGIPPLKRILLRQCVFHKKKEFVYLFGRKCGLIYTNIGGILGHSTGTGS
jgi:hypothetical protein